MNPANNGAPSVKFFVFLFVVLPLVLVAAAFAQSVTITVPKGTPINVVTETNNSPQVSTVRQLSDTSFPFPPPMQATTLSQQMRIAAQMARNQAAPWTTRFTVVKVEERPVNETERNELGLPDATTKFTTNYIVTLQPSPINETNLPVAWGAVKSGLLKMRMEFPVKVGDKFDLGPAGP